MLAELELSEDGWAVEERAWLDKVAQAAINGDARLAHELGQTLAEAQKRHGESDRDRSLEEYAEIHCWMELGSEPARVMERFELSIPAYVRLETRWQQAAEEDEEVARQLEPTLEEKRPLVAAKIEELDAQQRATWEAREDRAKDGES